MHLTTSIVVGKHLKSNKDDTATDDQVTLQYKLQFNCSAVVGAEPIPSALTYTRVMPHMAIHSKKFFSITFFPIRILCSKFYEESNDNRKFYCAKANHHFFSTVRCCISSIPSRPSSSSSTITIIVPPQQQQRNTISII